MLGAALALLVAAFAWGSMIPVLNELLRLWDPYNLSAIRYIVGALLFLFLLLATERRPWKPAGVPWWRVWLLGGVGFGLFAPLYTVGIEHAHPVMAAVLSAMAPVIAAITAWASFRVPLDRTLLPAILLAVAGAAIAAYRPGPLGDAFMLRGGEPLILLAGACWSWYSIAAQRWLAGASQKRITGLTMITGTIVLLIVCLAFGLLGAADLTPPIPQTAWHWTLFAWMTFASAIGAVFLWNLGVRRVGLVMASLFLNLVPVIAVLIIWVLGTSPTALQAFGGLLVLAGVAQAQLRRLLGARQRVSRQAGVA